MAGFGRAVVSQPGKERFARAPFGGQVIIHATADETGGAFGMWETITPPGQGPAMHIHTRETEMFRVVSGTYRFWCGDEVFDGPPGTVVVLPPHVPHTWRNISDEPGRICATVTPGGFERLFLEIEATRADTAEEIGAIEASLGLIPA